MKGSFTLTHFTEGFWAPQDHISKQSHTSEVRGLTPGRVCMTPEEYLSVRGWAGEVSSSL